MKQYYIVGFVAVIVILLFTLFLKDDQSETIPGLPDIAQKPSQDDLMMSPEEHVSMMEEREKDSADETETPDTEETSDLNQILPVNHDAGALKTSALNSKEKTIMVHADNFMYDPKEIRVKQGDVVTIHLMSMNGFHGFEIDEFNVKSDKISTGGSTKVTFTASKKGTFEYYCPVGAHHANGMKGSLIVE